MERALVSRRRESPAGEWPRLLEFEGLAPYNKGLRLKDGPLAQLVEQLTLNQRVAGSNPARLTFKINGLGDFS